MAFLLRNGASPVWKVSRNICRSSLRRDANPSNSVPKIATPAAPKLSPTEELRMGGRNHKVDNLEKRFLVWSGKYKSMAEVPAYVTQEAMERARNKARIKIANYMMLITALACIGMVISGKKAAERGESVQKMNLAWHQQIKDDADKEAAATSNK